MHLLSDKKLFIKNLFRWYHKNKRDLPWRNINDPYKIWISEIILQQTRVAQGLPYYLQFINKFPDIEHLAKAELTEVLKIWQGLGYYSRARNMHFAAQQIMNENQGRFPDSYEALLKLKGIGKYTAAAIASFAWKIPEPVMDGNVQRVLCRLFAFSKPANTSEATQFLMKIAHQIISAKHPDTFNQAMMELGAMVCTPSNPGCEKCPVNAFCLAFKKNIQKKIPVIHTITKLKTRYFYYAVIQCGNRFLVNERKKNDIWKGLYEFYLIEKEKPSPLKTIQELLPFELKNLKLVRESKTFKHILSHQTLMAKFLVYESAHAVLSQKKEGYKWVSLNQLKELPWPRLILKYFESSPVE